MKTRQRNRLVLEAENGRPDLELPADTIEDSIVVKEVPDGYIVGLLIHDTMAENPMEYNDGMGKFYHWKDHGREELLEYCTLLGYDMESREKTSPADPDAVEIDKYEHSGVAYSVRGEGMNCRWDTSTAWAVWYPDKCLKDELKELKGKERRAKCIEYARQACKEFNSWANGETYAVFIIDFDKKGEEKNVESCFGYIGSEYAEKELKDQIEHSLKERTKK